MNKRQVISLLIALIAFDIGLAVAFAGGVGGAELAGWPVMVICAVWAFALNWLMFIPANIYHTEKYYDLTGSLTYISVILLAVYLSPELDARGSIVTALVLLWAIRLGSFLFRRIARDGKDDRFDEIKTNPTRFFAAWTLQGLWVVLTSACAVAVITGGEREPMGLIGRVGVSLWVLGFIIEVIADAQKSSFKKDPENKGHFISAGLWAWSRHPNYFGEMVLWTGIAVIAFPVLAGWQYVTLISPVFVYVLIRYISGVNKLEEKANSKWGDDPEYQRYRDSTPMLMLWPPRNS
ncbi:MAG: DUF1295 domain-containing protein [Gammaproteobacteria bacterium]|nr:DUF1295 domain-containing protein [Gammaproteobacteria bacterium]